MAIFFFLVILNFCEYLFFKIDDSSFRCYLYLWNSEVTNSHFLEFPSWYACFAGIGFSLLYPAKQKKHSSVFLFSLLYLRNRPAYHKYCLEGWQRNFGKQRTSKTGTGGEKKCKAYSHDRCSLSSLYQQGRACHRH